METKFNQPVPHKKRILLRPGWQERLPIRPLLLASAAFLVLTLFVLINRPTSRVLHSAEMEMVKSTGVLRIGVDEDVYGLCKNGEGLETDIGLMIGETIFESTDNVTFVPCTRYSALWRMDDGYIDLAIMSMQSFSDSDYARNAVPFYTDECVLLGYRELPLAGLTVAVLDGTPAEQLLRRVVKERNLALEIVPCADYYTMFVKLRAGAVHAACLPKTVAMDRLERGMTLYGQPIGSIAYYAIAKKGSVLLELCDELFTAWVQDGTFAAWYEARALS